MNDIKTTISETEATALKKWGGKRPGAGRRRFKVRRRHWTIWASQEEFAHVKEYLFRNRLNDPE